MVIPKFVSLPDVVLVIKRDTGEKGIGYCYLKNLKRKGLFRCVMLDGGAIIK